MKIIDKFEKLGIIPVVIINDVEKAVPLAESLIKGGLPCAEVTFRTGAAKEAIQRMKRAFPDMLVGAGTVLSTEQVDQAIEAGAEFIVTPGFNDEVVEYCIEKEIPITPGCMDTYAIEKALSLGLEVIKFFPAEAAGGVKMIRALSGPYQSLRFLPTGGISGSNAEEYLQMEQVAAVGGSWMVKSDLIDECRFEEITTSVKEVVSLVRKVRG